MVFLLQSIYIILYFVTINNFETVTKSMKLSFPVFHLSLYRLKATRTKIPQTVQATALLPLVYIAPEQPYWPKFTSIMY